MTTTPDATPQALLSEAQLQQMAAEIRLEIPGAEVRLFGSWARGDASHDRWTVLDRLRWRLSQPHRPVDLLLFSQSQVEQCRQLHSSVVHQAYTLGWRLDG